MKMIHSLLFALALAGCATGGDPALQGRKPDYAEAARINTQLGIDYFRQGRTLLAIEKLERARDQDDSLPATHATLGLAYAKIEEFGAAEKAFAKALKLSDNEPNILNNYGVFLCDRGQAEKAEAIFMQSVANTRYATPEVAYANAGSCAQRLGQDGRAENYLRRALELNPRYGDAMLKLAELSLKNHDYLRARAFIQRYESLYEANADSLLMGLRTEFALGDYAASSDYANRLRKTVPGIGQYINLTTGQALK